jgi:hypothetical protein
MIGRGGQRPESHFHVRSPDRPTVDHSFDRVGISVHFWSNYGVFIAEFREEKEVC